MADKILTGKQTIAEMSIDAKLIRDLFAKAQLGDVVTYDDMSLAIGRDARTRRGAIQTALRIALRSDAMVFEAVSGIGYRRASDAEIVNGATRTFRRVGSALRRESRRQLVVDASKLSDSDRSKHYAALSMIGAIAEFARPSSVERIATKQPSAQLPVGRVLDVFK